jgi:hypothetical protein
VVPLGQKFRLVVVNEGAEPAEFESFVLHRELAVPPHSEAVLFIGPLSAGEYEFIDDFHPASRGILQASAGRAP